MNEMMMSPADIRAVTDGDGSNIGFGNGGMWIFALLILLGLLGGGFGGFGNRSTGNSATTEDLASGFNFSSLQSKANDILAGVNIPGATASVAITTANTQIENIAIVAIIRVLCCGDAA